MMAQAGPVSSNSGRFPVLPKYEILEELGHGGMATVYRAHDARLGRDVAIKILHPHLRDSREIAHRFATEAKAVAKLRHTNIVEVYDVSEANDGERYLVVELVRGTTLRHILEDRGPLPPEIAAAIALEILSALGHAHGEGVIHRDVKPENVLIEHPHLKRKNANASETLVPRSNPTDMQVRIKLTDFGIAKMLDAQGVTSTGQVLGSPAHMAPEQIEGGDVDARADVFGVGVLMYECMVGHLPFEGSNPAQVLRRVLDGQYNAADRDRAVVGGDWSRILDRALMLDPNARFADAQQMREAMLAHLKMLGIDDARAELEAYFKEPTSYEAKHSEKLVAKLRELGATARKNKDVQAAANAYNRALAYAPNDTQLLKVVSSLARAEERRKMLKRAITPITTIVLLGLGAFAITRILAPTPVKDAPKTVDSVASAKPPPLTVQSAPLPINSAAPRNTATARVAAIPATSASAKKETKRRVITLPSVSPPAGVRGTLDGDSLGDTEITSGYSLVLDENPHVLELRCINDMCGGLDVKVPAGDRDVQWQRIELQIRDAIVIVDGPSAGKYGIKEKPDVELMPGAKTRVRMSAGSENVTIIEQQSGKSTPVSLRPGVEVHADFTSLVPTP